MSAGMLGRIKAAMNAVQAAEDAVWLTRKDLAEDTLESFAHLMDVRASYAYHLRELADRLEAI